MSKAARAGGENAVSERPTEWARMTRSEGKLDRETTIWCMAKFTLTSNRYRAAGVKMFENVAPNWLVHDFFHFCSPPVCTTRANEAQLWQYFSRYFTSRRASQCTTLHTHTHIHTASLFCAAISSRLNQYLYFLFEFGVNGEKKRLHK